MGLSSLPVLNKLGYNSYWINLFNSEKMYSSNQSSFIIIEMLLKKFTEERFFFKFFMQNKEAPQYFHQFKYKKDIRYNKKNI